MMLLSDALTLTRLLFSLSVIFQTVEYLILNKKFTNKSIWNWEIIQTDYFNLNKTIQKILNFGLEESHFRYLLYIRLISGLCFLFFPKTLFIFIILMSTLLIAIRFRGSFNGGSDYMTSILSFCLFIITFGQPSEKIIIGVMWYISFQLTLSYFFAGLVKIKNLEWRNGKAIPLFLESSHYRPPRVVKNFLNKKQIAFFTCWSVMIFELFFPIIYYNHALTPYFLFIGALFHLSNFIIFGLNRFFWIWISSYPVVYYILSKS